MIHKITDLHGIKAINSTAVKLTDTDKKIIDWLNRFGGMVKTNPSGVGSILYGTATKEGYRKTAQGLALAGGLAMRRLKRKGILSIRMDAETYGTQYRLIKNEIYYKFNCR